MGKNQKIFTAQEKKGIKSRDHNVTRIALKITTSLLIYIDRGLVKYLSCQLHGVTNGYCVNYVTDWGWIRCFDLQFRISSDGRGREKGMSLNQIKIYRPGAIQLALNLLTFRVYLHTHFISWNFVGFLWVTKRCNILYWGFIQKMMIHPLGVLFEENAFLNGSLAIYGTRQLATHN